MFSAFRMGPADCVISTPYNLLGVTQLHVGKLGSPCTTKSRLGQP